MGQQSNDNTISKWALQNQIRVRFKEFPKEERLKKIEQEMHLLIQDEESSCLDELILIYLDIMRIEVYFSHGNPPTERIIQLFGIYRDLYESIATAENLPFTRKELAERVFDLWPATQKKVNALPNGPEIFRLMIKIYDQATGETKNKLSEMFKSSLMAANLPETSAWLMTPDLTGGLGYLLALHRARSGGFSQAREDVCNAAILKDGVRNLAPGAITALKDIYEDIYTLNSMLILFRHEISKRFDQIGCICELDYDYEYDNKLTIKLDIRRLSHLSSLTPVSLNEWICGSLFPWTKEWFMENRYLEMEELKIQYIMEEEFPVEQSIL